MQLSLVKKPREEIVSMKEAKDYLRISHDFDDSLLNIIIKSTGEAIEAIIQKSVMVQTWKYTINNHSIDYSNIQKNDFPILSNNIIRIPLPKPPILKIISVKIGNQEIDNKHYELEKINWKFCLCLPLKNLLNAGRKTSIEIEYEAGISDKKENIPYQLKLANLMLIANAYRERYSYDQNRIISQGVKQLLEPFLNLRII